MIRFEHDVDDHNIYAYMILLLLIRYSRLEIVKYLVGGKHSNVEATDADGWTPLHRAVR